jgi:hypothetical protein
MDERGQNPRAPTPNEDGRLGPLGIPEHSLVEQLGPVADDLRQIATDLGARPYRVWSVVVRWTGGKKGHGQVVVCSERELLPTPVVTVRTRYDQTEAGRLERGVTSLREISPRYTEDDIEALFPRCLERSEEAYIETRIDERDGTTRRRRYAIVGAPVRHATRFEWTVDLTPQDDRRTRRGAAVAPEV